MFEGIKRKDDKTVTSVRTNAMEHSAALSQHSSHSAAKQDIAEFSKDWQKRTDWNIRTRDTLEQLRQSYPDIDILLSENLSKDALSLTAASLGSGTHLILSEEFLQAMSKDQDSYNKYKEKLIKILNQLSADAPKHQGNGAYVTEDTVTYWHGDRAAKETEAPGVFPLPASKSSAASVFSNSLSASQKAQNYRIHARPSYKTAGSYARLAAAASKSQVHAVMGEAQRSMTSLRIASVFGEETDRTKAKKAIASLNKLLLRGGQKIRRLNAEEITRLRKKRAEQREQQEKAVRIKAELAKKQTERRTADGALIVEGRLDDIGRDYYHKKYKAYGYDSLPPAAPAFIPDISAAGLSSPDAALSFAPSEITISETVTL